MPPTDDQKAAWHLASTLQKFSSEIETLQREYLELRELAQVAVKTESLLSQIEIRFDNLREHHKTLCEDLKELEAKFAESQSRAASDKLSAVSQRALDAEAAAKRDTQSRRSNIAAVTSIVVAAITAFGAAAVLIIKHYFP